MNSQNTLLHLRVSISPDLLHQSCEFSCPLVAVFLDSVLQN